MYTEITIERIRLFVGAFCADNKGCMPAYISRVKYLTGTCNKLLSNIKLMKESTQWERPPFKFLPPYNKISWAKLQAIETSIKGMHFALAASSQSPHKTLDNQHLKEQISSLKDQTITRLRIQPNKNIETKSSHCSPLHVTLHDHLPSLFFLFSMNILLDVKTLIPPKTPKDTKISTIWTMNITTEKVVIALKCSLCISLSVLFGILFSNANGYWSGLMVATAFTPNRESTFKLATARAHGTALGFLHRSRMYDQAGATAAAVSAIILLGRRNYGSPMIFSIQRLTEAYIGLCCSILVEIVLQPVRSSTMARGELGESLRSLDECVESIINVDGLKEQEKKLVKRVSELKKRIEEGELEPNLWFSPFPVACYKKLCESLSKIGDLLFFFDHGMETLRREGCEIKGSVEGDLNRFKELVGGLVKSLEEVILVKSLDKLEKELMKSKDGRDDVEAAGRKGSGVSPWANWSTLSVDEEEIEKVVCCFIQHSREAVEGVGVKEVDDEGRSRLVLCFGAIGFCMGELMREMREVEEGGGGGGGA
ncbi:uncharacterized protein LOC109829612 [Asparagus officinalis]|uniref:uncharacterized protein LOC109829612 n=1 Tax=Asparagus officinalis TaxID=4686 RepID=UPI00098E5061|nr:uncharacterized protein LOC109829612 [Asparagus officinalis]